VCQSKLQCEMANFPKGAKIGMITFLFKAKEEKRLLNYCSITLSQVDYKIFAKFIVVEAPTCIDGGSRHKSSNIFSNEIHLGQCLIDIKNHHYTKHGKCHFASSSPIPSIVVGVDIMAVGFN